MTHAELTISKLEILKESIEQILNDESLDNSGILLVLDGAIDRESRKLPENKPCH